MPSDPPVDFQQLAQGATGTTNADYPYSIKATDLMKNFVFATLAVEDGLYEQTTGLQSHSQRKLRMRPGTQDNQIAYWDGENYVPLVAPSASSILRFDGTAFSWVAPPASGTYVLGSVDGAIQWIATEECS